jgi:EF hand
MKFLNLAAILMLISCSDAPDPVTPQSKIERQMIGLLEKFDRWDENGDGRLVPSELKETEKLSGHQPKKVIDFYDTNRDGGISLSEAQLGFSRAAEAEKKAKL